MEGGLATLKNDVSFICPLWDKVCTKFAKLRASRSFASDVPYGLSCLTCLRPLRTFMSSRLTRLAYVPYLRALRDFFTCLALFIYEPCVRFLCTLKSFVDRLVVHQKVSFLQGILKALQTCCFYVGQKTVMKLFKWENVLGIFQTWNQFSVFVFLFSFSSLQPWSN